MQVNGVKEAADYVAKLRRVGKGLGVYQFDAVSLHQGYRPVYYHAIVILLTNLLAFMYRSKALP